MRAAGEQEGAAAGPPPEPVARFARRFPVLYHATWPEAVPAILARGLLPAEALADLYGLTGAAREAALSEDRGRGNFLRLSAPGLPDATLRDQWLPEARLAPALTGSYAGDARAWRRLINAHAFFWLSKDQAGRLARADRSRAQVVLAFDAASLLARHHARASTTPINAGSAFALYGRPATPRGDGTLRPVAEFPRGDGRAPKELLVRGGVPDAADHLLAAPQRSDPPPG